MAAGRGQAAGGRGRQQVAAISSHQGTCEKWQVASSGGRWQGQGAGGKWQVASSGKWQVAGSKQQPAGAMRQVVVSGGRWQVSGGRCQEAGGRQQVASNRQQVTGGKQQKVASGRRQAAVVEECLSGRRHVVQSGIGGRDAGCRTSEAGTGVCGRWPQRAPSVGLGSWWVSSTGGCHVAGTLGRWLAAGNRPLAEAGSWQQQAVAGS